MNKRRPGRPRKFAMRESNGRLQRSTLAQISDADLAQRLEETAHAYQQPHRRDANNPRDERLENALGRFADCVGLPDELYQAGVRYGNLVRRYLSRKGFPGIYREPVQRGGKPLTDEEIAVRIERDAKRIGELNLALTQMSHPAYVSVRQLVVDNIDLPPAMHFDAKIGLVELAVEFNFLPRVKLPRLRRLTTLEKKINRYVRNSQ